MLKRKFISLFTALTLTALLVSCDSTTTTRPISTADSTTANASEAGQLNDDPNASLDDEGETSVEASNNLSTDESASIDESASAGLATIDSVVIVDQDAVKITAQSLVDDSIWGPGIKLLIENDSETDIVVSAQYLIVNNYMIPDLFSNTVAAGKKANETLHLSSSSLEEAGIESIGEIAFALRVYDDATWDDIFRTEEIVIQTSAYDPSSFTPLNSGKTLLDSDGVRIFGRQLIVDSIWGTSVQLFIENNRDHAVSISADDFSINGFMVTSLFSSELQPGRYALDEITIFDSDLEENGIETVEDIEMIFRIRHADSYDLIHESPVVRFSVE